MREEELEKQSSELLKRYTILPEFREWALEVLRTQHDKEVAKRSTVYESQHRALETTQEELDGLTRMRYRELITDEEYTRERDKLKKRIAELQSANKSTEQRAADWLETCERAFDFVTYAANNFAKGDYETKRGILMALGQNQTLMDGKLNIQANSWLQPIAEHYPALEAEYRMLEPALTPMDTARNNALGALRTRWRGKKESNPPLRFWRPSFYR